MMGMMANGWAVLLRLLAEMAIASCSSAPSEKASSTLEASAVAEGDASHHIVVRRPSVSEIKSIRDVQARISEVDEKYPRSPLPAPNAMLYQVTSVSTDGHIALSNGKISKMEGLHCSGEGVAYISRML